VTPTLTTTPAPERTLTGPLSIGFLTVLTEASGYLGGYLVTNTWGRPLEFRLSSAVQPNRVQQILYAHTLEPYICADLIGKTLVDKTGTTVQLVVTDSEPALDLRLKVAMPVVWLSTAGDQAAGALAAGETCVRPAGNGRGPLLCHARFPGDVAAVRELLGRLEEGLDLAEPLGRIREAIAEARKMGVAKSA
jgi:hypothetical protein